MSYSGAENIVKKLRGRGLREGFVGKLRESSFPIGEGDIKDCVTALKSAGAESIKTSTSEVDSEEYAGEKVKEVTLTGSVSGKPFWVAMREDTHYIAYGSGIEPWKDQIGDFDKPGDLASIAKELGNSQV